MLRRVARPTIDATAFLLCDVQGAFQKVLGGYERILRTASKMIDAGKILDIPLIATEQNPERLGRTNSALDIAHAKLVDPKMTFSMWTPNVQKYFDRNVNIKSVVLFGIETAQDLLSNGYQVFLLADGIDSMDSKTEVQVALDQLRSFGAIVSTSDSVLFQLLETAEHPHFRQISQIVKQHSSKL